MIMIEFLTGPLASTLHFRQGLRHCHARAAAVIGRGLHTATGETEGREGKADSAAEGKSAGESGLVS